jgi:hypothetical protein
LEREGRKRENNKKLEREREREIEIEELAKWNGKSTFYIPVPALNGLDDVPDVKVQRADCFKELI